MRQTRPYISFITLLVFCFAPFHVYARASSEIETLIKKMKVAYAAVNDYQAHLEVRTFRTDGSFETRIFLYTFKKPKKIRLDFESPYSGLTIVYPDQNGEVALRRFLTFHLSPDNFLLQVSAGQRIDQTDLGLLITNIAHSLTDHRQGPWTAAEEDRVIRIRVMADDHFRKGVVTLYQFLIDKEILLPIEVEESSPDGTLERTVVFRNLRTNIGVPDNFFQLNGDKK